MSTQICSSNGEHTCKAALAVTHLVTVADDMKDTKRGGDVRKVLIEEGRGKSTSSEYIELYLLLVLTIMLGLVMVSLAGPSINRLSTSMNRHSASRRMIGVEREDTCSPRDKMKLQMVGDNEKKHCKDLYTKCEGTEGCLSEIYEDKVKSQCTQTGLESGDRYICLGCMSDLFNNNRKKQKSSKNKSSKKKGKKGKKGRSKLRRLARSAGGKKRTQSKKSAASKKRAIEAAKRLVQCVDNIRPKELDPIHYTYMFFIIVVTLGIIFVFLWYALEFDSLCVLKGVEPHRNWAVYCRCCYGARRISETSEYFSNIDLLSLGVTDDGSCCDGVGSGSVCRSVLLHFLVALIDIISDICYTIGLFNAPDIPSWVTEFALVVCILSIVYELYESWVLKELTTRRRLLQVSKLQKKWHVAVMNIGSLITEDCLMMVVMVLDAGYQHYWAYAREDIYRYLYYVNFSITVGSGLVKIYRPYEIYQLSKDPERRDELEKELKKLKNWNKKLEQSADKLEDDLEQLEDKQDQLEQLEQLEELKECDQWTNCLSDFICCRWNQNDIIAEFINQMPEVNFDQD